MTNEKLKKRCRAAKNIITEVVDDSVINKNKILAARYIAEIRDEAEGALAYLRSKLDEEGIEIREQLMKWQQRWEDK